MGTCKRHVDTISTVTDTAIIQELCFIEKDGIGTLLGNMSRDMVCTRDMHDAAVYLLKIPSGPGDVIGMAIDLPPAENMEDLLSRLWHREGTYEAFRSAPPAVATGSEITYYKNGKCLGIAFRDLLRGTRARVCVFGAG